MDFEMKEKYDVEDLRTIVKLLRSDNGCPWDKVQTTESIKMNFIEECYEVIEAIENKDDELMCEELGDVLLQVIFHSEIKSGEGCFDFTNVCDKICKKLIARHPHVFSDVIAKTPGDVLENWEKIKKNQKGQKTYWDTIASVPKTFPALMKAQKIQNRAAKSGFDYDSPQQAFDHLISELDEVREAIRSNDKQSVKDEIGDLLFCCVNVARLNGIDSEEALLHSNKKFSARFKEVEKLAAAESINMQEAPLSELDRLWKKAKNLLSCH